MGDNIPFLKKKMFNFVLKSAKQQKNSSSSQKVKAMRGFKIFGHSRDTTPPVLEFSQNFSDFPKIFLGISFKISLKIPQISSKSLEHFWLFPQTFPKGLRIFLRDRLPRISLKRP